MKRSFVFSLSMVLALFSCETDPAVSPDPLELSLNEIDKNHVILVDAYKELSSSLSKGAIITLRKSSGDQTEFIMAMHEKANEAFKKVLNNSGNKAAVDYFLKIDGIDGESKDKKEKMIRLLTLASSTETYPNDLGKLLKEKSATVSEWKIFNKVVLQNGHSDDMPTESISFNFSKIEMAIGLSDIILDLSLTEQERTRALQDKLDVAQIPPVAVALLLPAIQKVRESAVADKADEMFLNWIDEEVKPATSGGLDRDIIRRKCFFEYLGGLDVIINQNYDNDNQLGASIAILKARYDMALLSLSADFWHLELAD